MKFENMVVGSFVERKKDGEVMLVIDIGETTGDIYLSGKNDCNLIYALHKEEARQYRKKSVSMAFTEQFKSVNLVIGKIAYLHHTAHDGFLEKGFYFIDRNDQTTVPFYVESENGEGWEYALNVAHPTHILAVEYNKRVDNGVVNKEEAMEIIKLLNASGIKESIAEM